VWKIVLDLEGVAVFLGIMPLWPNRPLLAHCYKGR
jgi:hypothetical protein